MNRYKIVGPPMGFYPSNTETLTSLFREFESKFEKVSIKKPAGSVRGMVVPHAGLVYSGFTAYCAYKLLSQGIFTETPIIVIFAPSHHSLFNGMITAYHSDFETPLGIVPTADGFLHPFLSRNWVQSSPEMHAEEHSLQVQIPFLQHFFETGDSIHLLPFLLSGNFSSEQWAEIFDEFCSLLPGGKKVIFIASSDLYHGQSYEECITSDNQTIDGILKDGAADFWNNQLNNEYMACGSLPIFALKYMAEKGGFFNPNLVYRTNSNEVTGEKGGYVVGYCSIIFSE